MGFGVGVRSGSNYGPKMACRKGSKAYDASATLFNLYAPLNNQKPHLDKLDGANVAHITI